MLKIIVNIFIILTFGINATSQVDGKFYSLNREICKEGNYWKCYSTYFESTYKDNYLYIHKPSIPSSECGRVFKIEDKYLILGTLNSFKYSDTLIIKSQTDNQVLFDTPNKYESWFSPIRKVKKPEIEKILTKAIGKKQSKGFYNFNQILISEKLFSKEEILKELHQPNFKEISNYDVIRLNFPKKWKKRINKELKKKSKKLNKEINL